MRKALNQLNLKSFVTAILLLLAAGDSHAQKQKLSNEEAIRLAEQFIAQNGYTDLPPDMDKLVYGVLERKSNVDRILKGRHDMLERKAYGTVRGRKSGASGWTVVFRYRHPANVQMRRHGRAVTMNSDGSEMRVEHVEFILKYVGKKL